MEDFAKKLIHDHRNPLLKVNSPGIKSYFKSSSWETEINNHSNLENILRYSRVERRCARAQAEWCADMKLAKVTKVIKGLIHSYGYQDKTGIFLYPEEMLFLLENNRLELMQDGIPLSVQECYDLVINESNCELRTYRIYKKLVQQGYKLIKYLEMLRRTFHITSMPCDSKKRKINFEESSHCKKNQIDSGSSIKMSTNHRELINKINDKLNKYGPKEFMSNSPEAITYDYAVFVPTNKSKIDYDFVLIICKSNVLSEINLNNSTPTVYAIFTEDNISFHTLGNVHLPFIAT